MRAAAATAAVVLLPTLAGARWFRGDALARVGLGGLVGYALAAYGALLAGLVGLPAAPLVGAAVGLAGTWLLGRRWQVDVPAGGGLAPAARRVLAVGAAVGLVLLALALLRPVAGWDGWAIWALKAKDFAATGGFSGPVYTAPGYAYSHPDYPPLLPAAQAVLYRLAGTSDLGWPLQVHGMWLWAAGGAGLAGLARRRGTAPLLAVLCWVLAPHVVRQALSGYADVPMAVALVAGTALLVADGAGPRRWPPAAVLLGAAAVTKHEGLLLALAVAAGVALLDPGRRGPALRAGAVVVLAAVPWTAFAALQGLGNDVASGLAAQPPAPGAVLARVPSALLALAGEVVWLPRWGLLALACAALIAWHRPAERGVLAAALLGFAALLAVYAVTPRDFTWHVEGSVDRVVTAPLGLVALAAATAAGRRDPRSPQATAAASRTAGPA